MSICVGSASKMADKKIVFITIVDGTNNDRQQVSQLLTSMDKDYNFIITPKEIKVRDTKDFLEEMKQLLDEKA